jgi:hypothetical protein
MQTKTTTADDMVGALIDSHPAVQPGVVKAAEVDTSGSSKPDVSQPAPANEPRVWRDKAGSVFDAEKFHVDQWGKPQYTKGGYFRRITDRERLKRAATGRKMPTPEPRPEPRPQLEPTPEPQAQPAPEPIPQLRPESHIPEAEPEPAPEPAPASDPSAPAVGEAEAAADVIVEAIFLLGVSVGGRECEPLPQHREAMRQAYRGYFSAKGIDTVPGELGLAVPMCAYAVYCYQASPRVRQSSQGVIAKTRERVGGWIGGIVGRRKARQANRVAQKAEAEAAPAPSPAPEYPSFL